MRVKLFPSKLEGSVEIPPSKSYAHRAIITASLGEGESEIRNVQLSLDIKTTIEMMENLGAIINYNSGTLTIKGINGEIKLKNREINCRESGSSIRFLIPLLLLQDRESLITGEGKLVERPLGSYYEIFERQGIRYSTKEGKLPLTIMGRLKGDIFKIPGNVSSQFITGLLFALPLLKESSTIEIIGELESKGYVDLTLDILAMSGIEVENREYRSFVIRGGQKYKSINYTVEGDYSQGAFFAVAGALGSNLQLLNLYSNSLQGDRAVVDIIKRMGGEVEEGEQTLKVNPSKTTGTYIDISQCPDIGPILTLLTALSSGKSKIGNGARLRIKESDRITSIRTELNKLGGDIIEGDDYLEISGVSSLVGGVEVESWNDHRVAMTLAIAATRCEREIILSGAECVRKSFPDFWDVYIKLGGKVEFLD